MIMKNGELFRLNEALAKIVIPQTMKVDELFDYLSAKTDIEKAVEPIMDKISKFRDETIPEGVDETSLLNKDPKSIAWAAKFNNMQNKLMEQDYDGEPLKPCLSKDNFAKMAGGLQTFEAVLVMKYLVNQVA